MPAAATDRKHQTSHPARLTGVLGLLFFLLAFVGQACHTHPLPQTRQHAATQAAGHVFSQMADRSAALDADTAETCSLCVAMHSATPAEASTIIGVAPMRSGVVLQHREVHRDKPITFARLSRPPPTLLRAA